MASKWETTPILLKHGDKDYGILDIVYAPDNSIYFTWSSSRKRIIFGLGQRLEHCILFVHRLWCLQCVRSDIDRILLENFLYFLSNYS